MLGIEVEKFGKIEKAAIELAPLTILVGKNNTGKSYMASLVWAMANLSSLLNSDEAVNKRPKWFNEFAARLDKGTAGTLHVDDARSAELIAHVNELFAQKGADFLSEVFAFKSFEKTKIEVTTKPYRNLHIEILADDGTKDRIHVEFRTEGKIDLRTAFAKRASFLKSGRVNRVWFYLITGVVFQAPIRNVRDPLYIPAARTGLMLALRSLVTQSFAGEEGEPLAQRLPRPLLHFLQQVTLDAVHSRGNEKLAEWVQKELLRGSLENVQDSKVPEFVYRPSDSDIVVPLYAASSMITELAPFMIALVNNGLSRHVIFEEPEAHLHLEAQRLMARVVAKLLASGMSVTITTHSDTFLQQINNLITLHEHPDKSKLVAELGYELSDVIPPEKVRAYEFFSIDDRTHVNEIPRGEAGFIVKSLNDTIHAIASETILINDVDD